MAGESVSPVIAKFCTAYSQGADTVNYVEPQTPHLLFIGCSDSRVPESAVFSSEPGDVFVHRNIANQFHTDDDNALSVLTYGLQTLKIQDVVVVGHTHCGGAEASYKAVRGLPVSPLMPLQRWLVPLTTLAGKVTDPSPLPNTAEYETQLELLIKENVKAQVENITAVIRALNLPATVQVQGLVYDIRAGGLDFVGSQVDVKGTKGDVRDIETAV